MTIKPQISRRKPHELICTPIISRLSGSQTAAPPPKSCYAPRNLLWRPLLYVHTVSARWLTTCTWVRYERASPRVTTQRGDQTAVGSRVADVSPLHSDALGIHKRGISVMCTGRAVCYSRPAPTTPPFLSAKRRSKHKHFRAISGARGRATARVTCDRGTSRSGASNAKRRADPEDVEATSGRLRKRPTIDTIRSGACALRRVQGHRRPGRRRTDRRWSFGRGRGPGARFDLMTSRGIRNAAGTREREREIVRERGGNAWVPRIRHITRTLANSYGGIE